MPASGWVFQQMKLTQPNQIVCYLLQLLSDGFAC